MPQNDLATRATQGAQNLAAGGRKTIEQYLEARRSNIARMLGQDKTTVDRFMANLIAEVTESDQLKKCSIESLVKSAYRCAKIGLSLGPEQHVHIIPFGNEATVVIGYRGLIWLAHRALPDLIAIQPYAIYENDYVEYELGSNPRLVHRPALTGEDRGKLVAAYVVYRFKDGETFWHLCDRTEILRHKKASRGASRSDSPWNGDNEVTMWLKTAIRASMNYVPQRMLTAGAEIAKATRVEEADDIDEGTGNIIDVDPSDVGDGGSENRQPTQTSPSAGQPEPPPADQPGDAAPTPRTISKTSRQEIIDLCETRGIEWKVARNSYVENTGVELSSRKLSELKQVEATKVRDWLRKTKAEDFATDEESEDESEAGDAVAEDAVAEDHVDELIRVLESRDVDVKQFEDYLERKLKQVPPGGTLSDLDPQVVESILGDPVTNIQAYNKWLNRASE